jgi:hypothetical protein
MFPIHLLFSFKDPPRALLSTERLILTIPSYSRFTILLRLKHPMLKNPRPRSLAPFSSYFSSSSPSSQLEITTAVGPRHRQDSKHLIAVYSHSFGQNKF